MANIHHGLCYFWDEVCQKFLCFFLAKCFSTTTVFELSTPIVSLPPPTWYWSHLKYAAISLDDVCASL